ncbi:MAG: hypothetical protein M3082_08055 [Candidatus Dormibacteraeota bacterium]|jgi:hypothetical protein|nr:hypothetical protein [Candidatus Dormibacteraeota bacterium]
MSITTLLLIIAFIAFAVAAIGWSYKKVDLIAIGLAAWVLTTFITNLSHITLSTILLILAFIAFVLAAIGWGYKKVGLIGVGLALWMAAYLVVLVIK